MIRARLDADLMAAMKARDARHTSVLRTTLAAIANAEAVDPADHPGQTEVARRDLSDDDVRDIVEREIAELHAAAADVRSGGGDAGAAELYARAAILAAYLG